jgi:hypothetical protein
LARFETDLSDVTKKVKSIDESTDKNFTTLDKLLKKTISNLEEHIDSVIRGKEHLATKKDIKMIKKIFTNYCSYDQMDSFKAEMKPMMEDT